MSPMCQAALSKVSRRMLPLHLQIRLCWLSKDSLIAAGRLQHPVASFTSTLVQCLQPCQ